MRSTPLWLLPFFAACAGPTSLEPAEVAVEARGTTPWGPLVPVGLDDLAAFDCTDAAAWSLGRRAGMDGVAEVDCLELASASTYSPPHRSPLSIALVRDLVVGDFALEADVMQTGREYGHRDFCLFFGFEDAANFYYVHLATSPDDNAHNVFLVDDAPRRRLADVSPVGVDWGTERWHRLRLERRVEAGTIRVLFDGEVVLETEDTTHGRGRIGFGSFDDTGAVSGVRLWSADADRSATSAPF